jgi:hypothetical protein
MEGAEGEVYITVGVGRLDLTTAGRTAFGYIVRLSAPDDLPLTIKELTDQIFHKGKTKVRIEYLC